MSFFSFERLLQVSHKTRWAIIILAFTLIVILDFSTPSQYVLAYLYTIPILVSISFRRSNIARLFLYMAVLATLLNLIFPEVILYNSSVFVNRILAVLSIAISTFFMLRYIEYQDRIQEQEKQLETERNLAQVREDLIATLTHDLKTPLLGEQKTLQYFQEETFGPLGEEQKEVLGALLRSNERQLSLVETLLAVYRNDNLGIDVHVSMVNLDELVADLLTELQYLATERKITMEYTCRQVPPSILAESLQIKRVFSNLIHNAMNYTPLGGRIDVRLAHKDGYVTVEVQDTGPGLSAQDLENVFHRFYRAGGDRQILGTGLGLYLSRQIIQAHQGKIWAENVQPTGCCFCFMLPIAREGLVR